MSAPCCAEHDLCRGGVQIAQTVAFDFDRHGAEWRIVTDGSGARALYLVDRDHGDGTWTGREFQPPPELADWARRRGVRS